MGSCLHALSHTAIISFVGQVGTAAGTVVVFDTPKGQLEGVRSIDRRTQHHATSRAHDVSNATPFRYKWSLHFLRDLNCTQSCVVDHMMSLA